MSAPPDGYTMLWVSPANAINATLYESLPFNFLRDTAPVGGLARFALVIGPWALGLARRGPHQP